jgi:hypothetical protein
MTYMTEIGPQLSISTVRIKSFNNLLHPFCEWIVFANLSLAARPYLIRFHFFRTSSRARSS